MPEFCEKSTKMIQEIVQLKTKLALVEAHLMEEFQMEVNVDFQMHRHLQSTGTGPRGGDEYRTDTVIITRGEVTVPLPTGMMALASEEGDGGFAARRSDVMNTPCTCGHPLGEHHSMDMNCMKCDCASFTAHPDAGVGSEIDGNEN